MTVINLRGLETGIDGDVPINGEVVAIYWAAKSPFVNVAGADVTFPAPIKVAIVNGIPAATLDLTPTGDECCVRWEIRSDSTADVNLPPRYTSIPDTGPVDFGDLLRVNPGTFAPEASPTLLEAIAQLIYDQTYDRF